ncbi:TIGR02270 family protein [Albitalea terrae]|uniref:TIGR02270 family protein n=1 Tax=Piscinibacter terrae TaxID=2496871 RepID=A0A3N7HVV8_9BURK|nr:TIGR02270 family protein [Albitalea terrae]
MAVVVQQHAEESAMLRLVRSVLVRAPHVRLRHLRRLDDRIAAHLDGLSVAGRYGTALCTAALERAGAGEVFAAAIRAIDEHDAKALHRLIALSAALPDARRGLVSAFGWVSAAQLQGIVRDLLSSREPGPRELALAACRLHRVDPGPALATAWRDENPALRAQALRAAGELGRTDSMAAALAAVADGDAAVAWRAISCAVLLGDRADAMSALEALAHGDGVFSEQALHLLLLATELQRGRSIVRKLAQGAKPDAALKRRVIRACGLLGDAQFVPWLMEMMADEVQARIAGEAFTFITGADLADLDLERKPPENPPGGPSGDPDDDNVALDDDESLPWPDLERVQRWWEANALRLPVDSRSFMGAAVTPGHVAHVLYEGTQRQRFAAATHRCLLNPGTALFPVCEPSWRQQRRLAALTPSA